MRSTNGLPTDEQRREAAASFQRLFDGKAPERQWQAFFAKHPFALSQSLPLRLQPWDIIPRGRDFRDEADFVFFDHTEPSRTFGVIELKRPDQKIIAKARKRIVRLTTDADIAIKQAQEYGRRFECELLELGARKACFALGNSSHLFVVMGLTDDLAYGMAQDISEMQLRNLVPPGIRFVTYDEVQRCLNNGLPRAIHVLCERSQTQTPVDPAVLPRTRHLRWDGRSRLVYTIPGKPPFSIRQHGTAALPPGISVDATTGVVTIPAQPS